MIDFSLTEEQTMLQKTAKDFAEKEINPVVEEIEKMDQTKFTPWDKVRPIFKKAARLGLTSLLIPEEMGGGGMGCIDNVLVMEELAVADMGIASAYFNLSNTAPRLIDVGATPDQRGKWLKEIAAADDHIISSAGSEADQAGSDSLCPIPDPKFGMRTFARKDGDSYVINGSKSAFITNAGAAKYYFVIARTDLNKPQMESTAVFYVPANTPGLSIGKRTHLIGWKTAMNAEVFLDDVRVPKESRLGGETGEFLPLFIMKGLPFIGTGFAGNHVGLARAAYEYALQYSKERVSWGQPIIKHQLITSMLADMWVNYQAARLVTWDAAYACDTGSMLAPIKSAAAKTYSNDAARANAESCVKVLGSYGITMEYKAQRYLSDAWIGYSCDGTNQMLRLHMFWMLSGEFGPPPGAGGPPGGGFGPPPGMAGPPPGFGPPPGGFGGPPPGFGPPGGFGGPPPGFGPPPGAKR